MDGRDTAQTSGLGYLESLTKHDIKVATVSGRYYAMDRDNNWDRIQKAYDNMTLGSGEMKPDALKGIQESYDAGITDEFIVPFLVDKAGLIEDHDAVIFANFRPDRAIRIATAISNPEATDKYVTAGKAVFNKKHVLDDILFVSMMHYNETVKGLIAFPLQTLDDIYGEVIAKNGLKQLRIAETEKYAHVTFFFDGGSEKTYEGATRILVESPKVPTYDLKPEMSAYEVRDKAVEAILSGQFDTMILNFANQIMVGITVRMKQAPKAVKTVNQVTKNEVKAFLSLVGVES